MTESERMYTCPKCGDNLFASVDDPKRLGSKPWARVTMACESEMHEDQDGQCGFITRLELMVRKGEIDWPEQEVLNCAFNPGDEFLLWDADSHRRNGISEKYPDEKPSPPLVVRYGRKRKKRPPLPDLRIMHLTMIQPPEQEKKYKIEEYFIRTARLNDPAPDFLGPFIDRDYAEDFWQEHFINFQMEVFCWTGDLEIFGDTGVGGTVVSNYEVNSREFADFCARIKDLPEVYEDLFFPEAILDDALWDIYVSAEALKPPIPALPQKDEK